MNKKSILNNISIDYVYTVLKNFNLSASIWMLYLAFKGLPLWQIGLLEGIFHVSSFLFEVPTGAIADLCGRKSALVLGRFFGLLSSIFLLVGHSFWAFLISFLFMALSYNLNSGSEEALVYDSLKYSNAEGDYLRVNSRINMLIEIAQCLSTFFGGLLAEKSFTLCFSTAIFLGFLELICAFFFTEPPITPDNVPVQQTDASNKHVHTTIKTHFIITYNCIRQTPEILKVLLYFPAVFTFDTILFYYSQTYFSSLGYNKIEISIFLLIYSFGNILGAAFCDRLLKKTGNRLKYIAALIIGVGIFLFATKNLFFILPAFICIGFFNSVLYPIQSNTLNALIPSAQRATILSVNSMVFSCFMAVGFPLYGFIADTYGYRSMFLMLGGLALLMLVFLKIIRIGISTRT